MVAPSSTSVLPVAYKFTSYTALFCYLILSIITMWTCTNQRIGEIEKWLEKDVCTHKLLRKVVFKMLPETTGNVLYETFEE